MKEMIALVSAMEADLSYNADGKARFHRTAKKALKTIAGLLGLQEGTYDLRSNKGGIAVSGEVTLHAEKLYVQISQSCMGRGHEILYRYCKGRKDYCGGHNHYLGIERLVANLEGAVTSLKTIMVGGQ